MAQAVLLLDDGELDDIQEMLEAAGITYARVRGGAIVPGQPAPTTMLIATPRRIDAVADSSEIEGPQPIRIVVVEEDSPTLRKRLRDVGFDYIVRRPVHPEALRLLMLHSVYTGEERRRDPRVPVGLEVDFKSGLFRRSATLAEFSARGCRLYSAHALDPGKRLKVEIPRALGATQQLWIHGKVLRVKFDERLGEAGLYSTAVVFDELPAEKRSELDWILAERSKGPPSLAELGSMAATEDEADEESGEKPRRRLPMTRVPREIVRGASEDPRSEEYHRDAAEAPRVGVPPTESLRQQAPPKAPVEEKVEEAALAEPVEPVSEYEIAPGSSPSDRRHSTRRAYASKVPAFGSRALRVLVGKDLSEGGMRVEHSPELELGDRLHLAIYGDADEEPMLVWATATRDDGDGGMAVVFDELHPSVAKKLEKVVANLPAIESLHDHETAAMGTIVSEILDT